MKESTIKWSNWETLRFFKQFADIQAKALIEKVEKKKRKKIFYDTHEYNIKRSDDKGKPKNIKYKGY